ncbi:MAG: SAM-dependent methyltransferase [Tenericutes bacterium HGW-Tenericutes-2]|jgi:tRNA1(Val) A37 N6-methylase TrmN6|nr:MAG: SAM-dependent methyltransferase [Tenericutes bacterium HGW-Tenericutes-2]
MLRTLLGSKLMIEQKGRQAFNLDTILLADFVKVPAKAKTLMDFGTGAGALILYMSEKTNASIIGVEIQEDRYYQAAHNIKLNHLESKVSVINEDVRKLDFKNVDCIISNPPFFKIHESSNVNESEDDRIARHEVMLTLDELIQSVAKALKFGGHFYMIHRPDRFAEIVSVMNKYQIEIKRVRFVHPYLNSNANHVLIQGIKNGQPGMTLESPLILYVEKHILTKEMVDIYGGRRNVTKLTE